MPVGYVARSAWPTLRGGQERLSRSGRWPSLRRRSPRDVYLCHAGSASDDALDQAPDSPAAWLSCWGRTNAEQVPKPRATLQSTTCNTETSLFVAGDLSTGQLRVAHSYAKSVDLNDFQFAAFRAAIVGPGHGGH